MITVELDIFSGRPNPVWTLTAKEENELFSRIMADKSLAALPKKVGHLGYRGFGIKVREDRSQRWRATRIPLSFFISAGHRREKETERFLLNTTNAGTQAGDSVLQVAQDSIDAANEAWRQRWIQFDRAENGPPLTPPDIHEPLTDGTVIVPDPDGRGSPDAGVTLKSDAADGLVSALACGAFSYTSDTNFDFWNADPYVMENNNCYNYAANWRSDTFAQPGRKANVEWTELACGNQPGQIGYAAAYDGFTLSCWSGSEYYTALVIWPPDPFDPSSGDFHWYRLCANGHWCHKPGSTPARNYDDSFNWITDPQFCDRGPYTIFCSYRYFPSNYTVR